MVEKKLGADSDDSLSVGSWFFTENKDFVGLVRQQDPLLDGQFHLMHRIGLGFWAAFDATYYWGGQTTVDGESQLDLQGADEGPAGWG